MRDSVLIAKTTTVNDAEDAKRIRALLRDGQDDFLGWLRDKPQDTYDATDGTRPPVRIPSAFVGWTLEIGINPLSTWVKERTGRMITLWAGGRWRFLCSPDFHELTGWAKKVAAQFGRQNQVELTATQALELVESCLRSLTAEDVAEVAERFPVTELEGALPA